MIYRVNLNNGERLAMEADYIETDGGGTRLYKNDGGLVATFYCGEATRVFPEAAIIEAEVINDTEEE